jgi:hypothetical protein
MKQLNFQHALTLGISTIIGFGLGALGAQNAHATATTAMPHQEQEQIQGTAQHLEQNPETFQTLYTVASLNINSKSKLLRAATHFASAQIEVNRASKLLRLIVHRNFYCAPGTMCPMVMPKPLRIELPIVHEGTGQCGERVIVAEKDSRTLNGSLAQMQIHDDNGNLQDCEGIIHADNATFVKNVNVTLTEQSATELETIVSELIAIPSHTLE